MRGFSRCVGAVSRLVWGGALLGLMDACGASQAIAPDYPRLRELPPSASKDWLSGKSVLLEPFVSGSINTPVSLFMLPERFHRRYPLSREQTPAGLREQEVAASLYRDLSSALGRHWPVASSRVRLLPGMQPEYLRWHHQTSAHPEDGGFTLVRFEPAARRALGASEEFDRMAPFRGAYVISAAAPVDADVRLVTGSFGIRCQHEWVGRGRRIRAYTALEWLVALVDRHGKVMAQAFLSVGSVRWACPVLNDEWDALVDGLVSQLVAELITPE